MGTVVDLRSDTVTRPTDPMRKVMADAEVGDDVYGEDPNVNALQEEVADRFGREAALFVPSGVMANQVSMLTLAPRGTEAIVESTCHLVAYEAGAAAALGGIQFRTVDGDRGRLDRAKVAKALRPPSFPYTENSVVAIEQTTNRGGGAVHDRATLDDLRELTTGRGLRLYMDGARIFNAVVASGISEKEHGQRADLISFCVSKGLGAPVGSLVVGDADAIEEAKGWRRRLGGAMRQSGVLAAAARYALDNHVERLAEDHARAQMIAEIIADARSEAVELEAVQTNIVYVDTGEVPAAGIVDALADENIRVGAMGPYVLRLVTHLDVDTEGCRRAAGEIARMLTTGRG